MAGSRPRPAPIRLSRRTPGSQNARDVTTSPEQPGRHATTKPAKPRPETRWPSMAELWTVLAVTLPGLAALLVPMPSLDLAYQLRAGASILAGEGIPATDTWTFTVAGTAWLDQQWGAQVLLAGIEEVAGWTGLALVRAGLVGVTFWFVNRALRSMGWASRPAAIITLLSFVVAAPALALRPQLFAIALFAATVWILAERRAHPRRLWLIPVIAALWANLHGSFPLVVVLVALAWLDEVARAVAARRLRAQAPIGRKEPPAWIAARPAPPGAAVTAARREHIRTDSLRGSTGIALVGAVAALATLANPFGVDVWRYVVALAANPSVSGLVSEWRPPSLLDAAGLVFYVSLAVAAAVAALRIRADGARITPSTVAPVATIAVFGVVGMVTGRGLAWWALAGPIAAATLAYDSSLGDRIPRLLRVLGSIFAAAPAAQSERRSPANGALIIALVAAGVALLPAWRPVGSAGVPIGTLSHAPQGIAGELRELVVHGDLPNRAHVWNPQAWGSWLELAVPETLVAVDSRIELFPPDVWREADEVARGAADWSSILDRYRVDAVIVPAAPPAAPDAGLAAAIESSTDWELAYRDDDGSIYIRAGE